jgi:hypothetical protein
MSFAVVDWWKRPSKVRMAFASAAFVSARFDPESPPEAQALSPLRAITNTSVIVEALLMLPPHKWFSMDETAAVVSRRQKRDTVLTVGWRKASGMGPGDRVNAGLSGRTLGLLEDCQPPEAAPPLAESLAGPKRSCRLSLVTRNG